MPAIPLCLKATERQASGGPQVMMHRRVSNLLRLIPPVVILSLAPALAVSDDLDVPAIVRQSPPDPDGDPPQWLNRAVDLFDQGALANEMNGARPVTKWLGSIDIAVRGDAGRTWLARVEQIAGDLSHVTGRSITVDDNPLWAGDMDVYVGGFKFRSEHPPHLVP
jgi:hypothetical protein